MNAASAGIQAATRQLLLLSPAFRLDGKEEIYIAAAQEKQKAMDYRTASLLFTSHSIPDSAWSTPGFRLVITTDISFERQFIFIMH